MARLVYLGSCLLAASVGLTAGAQEVLPISLESLYYPLKEGNKWVYAVGKKEVVVTVHQRVVRKLVRRDAKGQERAPELVLCWQLHIVRETKRLTEVITVLEDGLYRVEAAGKAIDPPLCFLKLGKGPERWEVKAVSETVKLEGTFTRGNDAVEVPGLSGKMPTVKSSCADFRMGNEKMEIESWFAPNVGLVQQIIKMDNHEDVVMKLKAHNLKK